MSMLDASKIGFRWKGQYAEGTLYVVGDTVSKDGFVKFWDGSTWRTMASGQVGSTTKGDLIHNMDYYLSGAVNQKFTVSSVGRPIWQYDDISRTNGVLRLPEYYAGTGYSTGHHHNMHVIMTDGTVMAWGRNLNKSLGAGNQGDIGRSLPVQLQFYSDTAPIVKLFGAREFCFALDADGRIYGWGHNNYGNVGNGTTTDVQRPTLINGKGDLPENAVVVDCYPVCSYNGYKSTMFLTEDGKVYCCGRNDNYNFGIGDGSTGTGNQTTPRLSKRSEMVPMKKIFNGQMYYAASAMLGEDNILYVIGETSSSLSTWSGNPPNNLSIHEAWAPSVDPGFTPKQVVWHESDDHSQTGTQYHRTGLVVSEEGNMYSWQVSNRRSQIADFNPAGTFYNEWLPETRIDNIAEAYTGHGGYEHIIARKKNGEIWAIGQDQYGMNGFDADGNDIAAQNTWARNYHWAPDIVKLTHITSRYGNQSMGLTASGYVQSSGNNTVGNPGYGWANNIGDNLGSRGADDWPSNTQTLRRMARVPDAVVDYYTAGYVQDATTDLTTYYLTDRGELWSAGAGSHGRLGWEDDNENGYTPQRVRL